MRCIFHTCPIIGPTAVVRHRCIENGKTHFDVTKYNDATLLRVLAENQEDTWQQVCRGDPLLIPARVRRWRRMVANEVHRRGL
jgi:hypothetical protein